MGILVFAAGLQVFVEPQLISSSVYPGLASNWSLNQLSYSFAFQSNNLGGRGGAVAHAAPRVPHRCRLRDLQDGLLRRRRSEREMTTIDIEQAPTEPRPQEVAPHPYEEGTRTRPRKRSAARQRRLLGSVLLLYALVSIIPMIWLLIAPSKTATAAQRRRALRVRQLRQLRHRLGAPAHVPGRRDRAMAGQLGRVHGR